jgi:hypothetical protein
VYSCFPSQYYQDDHHYGVRQVIKKEILIPVTKGSHHILEMKSDIYIRICRYINEGIVVWTTLIQPEIDVVTISYLPNNVFGAP